MRSKGMPSAGFGSPCIRRAQSGSRSTLARINMACSGSVIGRGEIVGCVHRSGIELVGICAVAVAVAVAVAIAIVRH